MYESDGSIMVYWHALDALEMSQGQAVFARGIAAAGGQYICVGTSSGLVLVFDVPAKGTNITLSEILAEQRDAITDIASETCGGGKERAADMVTADDRGLLIVWKSGQDFQLVSKISSYGETCSSVKMWDGMIAASYGTGQIRVYEAATGIIFAELDAHARWIYTMDVAPETGRLLSAGEDSFVQIWQLSRCAESGSIEVDHRHAECVTDTQICGGRFCDPQGSSFAVTGYDLNEIIRYVQI
ncbi:WD repeat-containing protein 54 [Mantella aurantiaca]